MDNNVLKHYEHSVQLFHTYGMKKLKLLVRKSLHNVGRPVTHINWQADSDLVFNVGLRPALEFKIYLKEPGVFGMQVTIDGTPFVSGRFDLPPQKFNSVEAVYQYVMPVISMAIAELSRRTKAQKVGF